MTSTFILDHYQIEKNESMKGIVLTILLIMTLVAAQFFIFGEASFPV